MSKKLDADTRLKKAHIWLMGNERTRIYSGLILCGESQISKPIAGCNTAWTDGYNTRYVEEFVQSIGDKELRGLVLHENLHKAYRHRSLYPHLKQIAPEIANIANDLYINNHIADLTDAGLEIALPYYGHDDLTKLRTYKGLNVPQIFERLLVELKKALSKGDKNGKGNNPLTLNADSPIIKQLFGDLLDKADHHEFDGGDTPQSEEAKAQRAEQDAQIERALRQAQAMQGAGNCGELRQLLEGFDATVDWQTLLREHLISVTNNRNDSTWAKPNRRHIARGVYMPTNQCPSMGAVVIAIDTSGSIGDTELSIFLAEVESIIAEMQPEKVILLYWDNDVAAHEEYEDIELCGLRSSTKPAGGGGTNLTSVPKYLTKKGIEHELTIVFTDGCVGDEWGVWDKPVIFAITTDNLKAPEELGPTIHIELTYA